jgi:Macrocin-O-methyltransferase (TylF)
MVSREIFLHDPIYEERYIRLFRGPPEKPAFEIYMPKDFLTTEMSHAVMRPIWTLEASQIWPLVAEELAADGVKGDFIEFGVYSGGSFARLMKIFRGTGIIHKFWGFDSFEGLPEPQAGADQVSFKGGQFRCTRSEAEARILADIDGTEKIELVQGWFAETLPLYKDVIKDVAFCRIDCDLYSSTHDCLGFLKGRLVNGAVLYFDDWTHDVGTGETRAFFEFAESVQDLYTFESLVTVSSSALAIRVWHRDGIRRVAHRNMDLKRKRTARIGTDVNRSISGSVATKVELSEELVFGDAGNSGAFLRSGFSVPEPWGIWTIEPTARIAVPIKKSTRLSLWLQFQTFARTAGPPAGFVVEVHGQEIGTFSAQSGQWGDIYEHAFEIPENLVRGPFLEIDLKVENGPAPAELRPGQRPVGIGLHRMRLCEAVAG